METIYPQLWILLDVVIAAILAGIIGVEREAAEKPAGFRTHMLIGGIAALLVPLGRIMVEYYSDMGMGQALQSDPIRIFEAIIVGISFIGAGTILKMRKRHSILYLTTAASILFSAGVGISVALKQYYLAFGLTVIVLLINRIVRYISFKMRKQEILIKEKEAVQEEVDKKEEEK